MTSFPCFQSLRYLVNKNILSDGPSPMSQALRPFILSWGLLKTPGRSMRSKSFLLLSRSQRQEAYPVRGPSMHELTED